MSDTFTLEPKLLLLPCLAVVPERITEIAPGDIEREFGAIGVGSALSPNNKPLLVLSIHLPDGDARMAVLDAEDCARMLPVLQDTLIAMANIASPPPVAIPN